MSSVAPLLSTRPVTSPTLSSTPSTVGTTGAVRSVTVTRPGGLTLPAGSVTVARQSPVGVVGRSISRAKLPSGCTVVVWVAPVGSVMMTRPPGSPVPVMSGRPSPSESTTRSPGAVGGTVSMVTSSVGLEGVVPPGLVRP